MHERMLKDYIVVHDNTGKLIDRIQMDRVVVGLGFLDDESLLIVLSKGVYMTRNPYTGNTRFYTITPEQEFESDPIYSCQIFGNSFVYMTRSFNFYLIENIRKYTKSKIFAPGPQQELDVDASQFSVLPGKFSDESVQVFIPATTGVIKATQHPLSQKKEVIFQNITQKIIKTSISPNGRNLAVITTESLLVRSQSSVGCYVDCDRQSLDQRSYARRTREEVPEKN